jgi:DNA excision repair protein ERCC-4
MVKKRIMATAQTDSQSPNKALTLPALKSLGKLAEAQPIIEIDSREQTPLVFTRLQSIEGATLSEGDYGIAGVTDFRAERKGSLGELASCCVGSNRDRFERELRRLLPYKFKRLLLVGASSERDILTYPYHSAINPRCVLGSLFAWQARFDLPYVFVPTPEMAARLIETWALYWCREICQSANGLLRSYWRSAKARIPTVGLIDEPEEPTEPQD